MDERTKRLIVEARRALHELAELPGEERKTRAFIRDFLRTNTDLQIADRGSWLYAKHHEGAAFTLVIRADHDAVPTGQGPRHLCGHDGHTAALLGLALLLKGRTLGKNVILLFQPAEETGAGAAECCALFGLEGLTRDNARILGCHNIPGESLGTVLLRHGTFACASCGVEIALTGSPTHAAYPENGVNPAAAAARLALALPEFAVEAAARYGGMALATVVGMQVGERAFGVAASKARLWATLRAEKAEAFAWLNRRTDAAVREAAEKDGLHAAVERLDVFPATVNDDDLVRALERSCARGGIPYRYPDVPFRWSEDFGHYGSYVPGCFFGVGAGEDTAPLHTKDYVCPDALPPVMAELFFRFASEL